MAYMVNLLPIFLAAASGLTLDDRAEVEGQLSVLTFVMAGLIATLLALALTVRIIAKRTTAPCPACMEFISKQAAVCPKCGQSLNHQDTKTQRT